MQRRSMMDPPKHLLKQIGPLALLLFGACHQTRIVPLPEPRNGQTRTDVAGHSKSYVLGYFEGAPFRADCRDGVESIRISMGVLDTVIQVLAGGLFSTRSVEVRCLVPHLDVAALERGQPVRLPGVHFEPNASRLQSDSLIVLDERPHGTWRTASRARAEEVVGPEI